MADAIESMLGKLIEPMPGRIAVKVEILDVRTATGLYLPEETARSLHEQRPTQGVVVAIAGEYEAQGGELETDYGLKVGDRVVFGKFTGTIMNYQPDPNDRATKEKIVLLNEKDVLCRLVEPVANLQLKS